MLLFLLILSTVFCVFIFVVIARQKIVLQRVVLEEDLEDDVKLRLNKFKVIVNNLNTYGHLTKLHALSTQVSPLYTAEYC